MDPHHFSPAFAEKAKHAISRWAKLALSSDAIMDVDRHIIEESRQESRGFPQYAAWLEYKARSYVAIAFERNGDFAGAARNLEWILRRRVIQPFERTALYLNLGHLYSKMGQVVRARSALHAGIRIAVRHNDTTAIDLLKAMIYVTGVLRPTKVNVKVFTKVCGGSLPKPLTADTFTDRKSVV